MDWDITFITHAFDINGGGSNRSLDVMARSLSNRGCQVTVLSLDSDRNSLPPNPPYDVEEYYFSNRPQGAYNLYHILNEWEENTDLFHIFHPAFHPIAGLYRNRGGTTPVVGRLNGYAMFCPNVEEMTPGCYYNCSTLDKFRHDDTTAAEKLLRLPEYTFRTHGGKRLANGVDRLFAISPAVKRIHETKVDTQISVVPNFSDPEFDQSVDTAAQSDDKITLLYVGRLVKNKGVSDLIEAVDRLHDRSWQQVQLEIVGDGKLRQSIENEARSRGLSECVSVEGWIPYEKLPQHYLNADLFVHPGRWPEPFGRTVLEALQTGTPVLVTDIGAPPWIVGDAGKTCEPSNVESLTNAIKQIADNPARLDELRSNTTRRAERFSRERVTADIHMEYADVID